MNTPSSFEYRDPRENAPFAASARSRSIPRPPHRARDFGVGYGSSSGYASANRRRYADSWAKQPFSCW